MSGSDQQVLHWPGKSAGPCGVEHPALYHMLDVAAVAEQLIGPWRFSPQVAAALVLQVALHDLGKISDSFCTMLREGQRQYRRHWEMTEVLLAHHDTLLEGVLGGTQRQRHQLYAAIAGHHGGPPMLDNLHDPRLLAAIGDRAVHDAGAAIGLLAKLWPQASLQGLNREQLRALTWWLPGFIAVSDWVGSNTDWFAATAAGPDMPEYLALARKRAEYAVCAAGLDDVAPSNQQLFDFTLRPMQQACIETGLPEGSVLAVIEDETGAGKTEAALILAHRMMQQGKGRGVFFALPTTATADAMFRRAKGVVGRMFQTPPSLTLAHGRAGLSQDFRALTGAGTTSSDGPVCSEWLADNRRRALLATVGVGTIDQALLSVLPTRFATLRHYGLASKILIVDEVHEMGAPYMATELAQLLRAHRMAGGSAILLTATLPLDQRRKLLEAWGAGDDGHAAYPALTIADGQRRDMPQIPALRGAVGVDRLPDMDAAVMLLGESARQGAACVWVRNAVDDAIAAVDALRAAGVQAQLLHARFTLADRLRHETRLLAQFGKQGQGREGCVLVATQVVESSLDLDFDVMVSDLAPMAALIQRAGRLWRHMDLRPADSRPVAGPVLHVVSPDPETVGDGRWLHRVLDRGAWVYPVPLQWRTAAVLFGTGRIDAPSDLRRLIEAAHGEDALSVPAPLESAELERIGKDYAEANQARRNLIDLAKGYRGNSAASDTDYPTRLGLPQRTLLLARHEGGLLVPYAGENDAQGWQLSEVQLAEHRVQDLALPDQGRPEIAALVADWPEWRKQSTTICPLDDEGRICDGLRYDPERGVVFDG